MDKVMNRREFGGHLVGGAVALAVVGSGAISLTGCDQTSVINKVLALLPTVNGIVDTAGDIVSALDPAIALPITTALGFVDAGFKVIENILTQYEANLSAAPNSVWQELDNAVASIEAQISTIEGFFPKLTAIVKAGIQVALTAFQTLLGYIASLMPAPLASAVTPRAFAALNARSIQFGVSVSVPSRRQFAKQYNANMDAAGWKGYKKCHIHVPLF